MEQSAEKQEVCCDIVFPRNDREATPIKSHQYGCHDLNRDNSNRHVSVEGVEKEIEASKEP